MQHFLISYLYSLSTGFQSLQQSYASKTQDLGLHRSTFTVFQMQMISRVSLTHLSNSGMLVGTQRTISARMPVSYIHFKRWRGCNVVNLCLKEMMLHEKMPEGHWKENCSCVKIVAWLLSLVAL